MARVYLNDSEAEIREKLNLQAEEINEDFAELQNISEKIYKFRFFFDPTKEWSKLDKSIIIAAQAMIKKKCEEKCEDDSLNIENLDVIINDLSQWMLYRLHRTARKAYHRSKKTSYVVSSFTNTNNSLAAISEPGSSVMYDAVKDAAKNAAKDVE